MSAELKTAGPARASVGKTTVWFPLLRSVSRSFYLSVRYLPGRIQPPILLGYLLARAADTIADTSRLPASDRLELMRALRRSFFEPAPELAALLPPVVQAQSEGGEKLLLAHIPELLGAADALPTAQKVLLADLLTKITRGQELDLERFELDLGIAALRSAEELDEYTYLVAGCVGEFWTKLGWLAWKNYSRLNEGESIRLGILFGQGLQLINVLRDFAADVRLGRSYLPVPDAAALSSDINQARPLFDVWLEKAWQNLGAAWTYVTAVRPVRVRFACAVPVLIGVKTLQLLGRPGPILISAKISRAEVRRCIATAVRVAVWPSTANRVWDGKRS
ncbi:MAG: squalene/phytoene synthase family protein [Verrucomicrobia bacterium]|nr:squalene/phytoene synthase family protein [Verrucomicrobiota bacterium]